MIRRANDNKGVSPVVGFLLIILIVTIAIAQYRMNVVPVQERSAETDHFQDVNRGMLELQSEIIQSSATGQTGVSSLNMGVDYDDVRFSLSTFPEAGRLTYIPSEHDITIDNAHNNKEASNFWRGQERNYDTGFIEYDISYNRFQGNPELRIEHGFYYSEMPQSGTNSYIPRSDQPIIDGRNINIHSITGQLGVSESGEINVQTTPVSAPANTVSITDDGEPIEIELPSQIPAEIWEQRSFLQDEIPDQNDENTGFIESIEQGEDIDNGAGTIIITLETDITYNLQMSRINVSTQSQGVAERQAEREYIAVQSRNINIREDSTVTLEAQVRDRFNNGVSGVNAKVEAVDQNTGNCFGDFIESNGNDGTVACTNQADYIQPGSDISDQLGDVEYVYQAPESEFDRDVSFSYYFDD